MWHFGPEIGREHLQLPVCWIDEERRKLLDSVDPIHVEGEQTAVHAADVTSQDLQLSPVTVPCREVQLYKVHDVGQERYDSVRIKIIGIR